MSTDGVNPRRAITGASAQLLGWVALALLNQLLVELVLPKTSMAVRLLHHAHDVAQLALLGVVSWAAVQALELAAERFDWKGSKLRRTQAALLGAVVGVVAFAILGPDVAGFAERTNTSPRLVAFALALASALALGSTRLLITPRWWWLRLLQAGAGAGLATLNALHLENDYFAYHLLLAWFSALLIANSLEGVALRGWSRRVEVAFVSSFALAGCLALVLPPRGDVRIRLFTLPSSALAPHLARFLSDDAMAHASVPPAYLNSPWFRDRANMPDVPATGAFKLGRPPIVMFFTVDAFRADVIEKPEHRQRLPTFSRLYAESTYFKDAHPPTTSTMTTMSSVLAGKYYTQLLWPPLRRSLIEPTPRFPQLLQKAGVRTAAFTGPLGRITSRSGVALGFTTEVRVSAKGEPARNTVDRIIEYLDASPDAPLFIYSHFIDPHPPYTLGGKHGSAFERYFREVMLVDRELGRLQRYLQDKGLADNTYLIVSADHGEAFGEHASFGHAKTVYEEQAHVPFFFLVPGRPGQVLTTRITLMDVGPTVLDLFGLPTPGRWMGQSLLPVVTGQKSTLERPVALDTGRDIQALYFDDGYKVIFNRNQHTTEVYDLKADPGELANLAGANTPRTQQVIAIADLFFSRIRLNQKIENSADEPDVSE